MGQLVIAALEGLSRSGFEITCYSNSRRSDALTARFQNTANWCPVWALGDDELEAKIRADRIDILFDLSGYSRDNRLGIFARKSAPIQIAWVGYPATTGLPAMDYLLTDHWQTPSWADHFYSERLLRLPHSYICFDPPPDAPESGDPPFLRNGFVTFGSFNALKKINLRVIELWSRILVKLQDARLLLKCPAFDCSGTRQRMIASFERAGVTAGRLDIRGGSLPKEHMAAMAEADIGLDTFPYSGGMTTLDLLWMGLPVITLPGETMASRHSLGYLSTIGLGELAAPDPDTYVALATALVGDLDKLVVLRAGMRARVLSSPLANRNSFCAELGKMLEMVFRSEAATSR